MTARRTSGTSSSARRSAWRPSASMPSSFVSRTFMDPQKGSVGAMGAPLALIEDGAGSGERVIALRGEIDVGSTGALQDWLARASGGGAHSVVVDFEHVDFMAVS